MDPAIEAKLHAFERLVGEHVETILRVASAAPPGGDFHWDRMLAHYAVAADAPATRLEHVGAAGQVRGATVVEVERVLAAMAGQARSELDRIVPPVPIGAFGVVVAFGGGTGDVDLETRVGALRARLDGLPRDQAARYQATVCPPRAAVAASVGSVFANAQSTAKLAPWANVKIDPARVFRCSVCGAPQEVALDFVCKYCRNPMSRPKET